MRGTWLTDERGSQTVELLMIVPAVLMLVLCLGEFGKAALHQLTLQSAVRDGAHMAALQCLPEEVEAVVKRAAGSVPIQTVEITQHGEEEISVKVFSLLELKILSRLGLPAGVNHLRLEAESHVPLIGKHG